MTKCDASRQVTRGANIHCGGSGSGRSAVRYYRHAENAGIWRSFLQGMHWPPQKLCVACAQFKPFILVLSITATAHAKVPASRERPKYASKRQQTEILCSGA